MTDLTKMFNPDSVAIVGASNSEGKMMVLKEIFILLTLKMMKFKD